MKCTYYTGCTNEATFGPDPYAQDIYDDDTPVWMCADCRDDSAMEI